ncbi:MAG: tRNA (adenosine(37)-N6)-threonylcarbamoyltransferase complex dimerization subunit type 1 TsaB [Marinilabiliaceae bacterium]
MAYILCIETSTNICSVALTRDRDILAARQENEGNSHANRLTILTEQLFNDTAIPIDMEDIDAVAVSSGPGSYTGLRIGVSTAKGICFALDKPLIALTSLSVLAWPVVRNMAGGQADSTSWFCPMIDARRMEVYSAMYDQNMDIQRETRADVVDEESYRSILDARKVFFFGNGAEKCKAFLNHPNAIFPEDEGPLARNMATLAFDAYENGQFEDVAYFEPFYLKDFIATIPKRKVI